MKRKSLLVAFSLCMIWVQRAADADEFNYCSLSMMTYNIKAAINLGPAEQGLEKIAQVIEAAGKPDVLMLQEVMRFDPLVDYIDEFQWLKDRLGYPYGYFTSGQEDPVPPGTAEWGNAIYLANNTGSVISSQKYRIGWNRSLCRVTVSIQGTTVHFFNTHTGSGAIPEQVETIAGIIEDYTALQEPVILGGDFNATAYNPAMAPLRQHLEDMFIVLSIPVSLIDTFYISPEVTAQAAEQFEDETHASDHNPTIGVLSPWLPLPGPTITQQPQPQDRCPGDTVVFTVAASGSGTLSYQWQKDQVNQVRVSLTDGGRISGATSPTLTISNVEGSDVARYRCVVTDNDCSRASDDPALTLTPTAIVIHPSDQTVGVGGTASLSVVAEGAGTLSYQWQKDGTDLVDDGRIVGANSANLQISNCGSSDQGDYRCVVSGYCGTETSSAATLTVDPEPPISFYEDWDDYAEGRDDPAYVSRWETIPGTLRYEIFVATYDEFSPPNAARVSVDDDPTGITHPLAPELSAVVPGADQVRGTVADPLELLVKLYLQYTYIDDSDVFAELSMGDVHAPAGNSGTVLPVLAFGLTAGMHGSAAYPRFFDGKNWHNVTGISIGGGHNDLKMTVLTNSVQLQGLRVASGSATLTRLYTGGFDRISLRTVYNTMKWRSLSDVSLMGGAVEAPTSGPTITQQPQPQNVCAGETATFSVSATGTGTLTYRWQKDQTDLSDGGDISGATTATLQILNTDGADEGNYRCVVTDDNGSTNSDEAALTIGDTTITQHPSDQNVADGGTATFTVAATGKGTLTYQWQKDLSNLTDGGDISGATTDTLQIANVETADEGSYRCVVTGDCGFANSNGATLIVTSAGDECLLNAGFENGFVSGVGQNWTKFNMVGDVVCASSTDAYSDVYSQRVTCEGYEDGGVYQQFDVIPGNPYTVAVWIKCISAGGVQGFLGVDPYGGTDPNSGNIWWGSKPYDYYSQKTWNGTALGTSGKITVFLRAQETRASETGDVLFDEVTPSCGPAPVILRQPSPQDVCPGEIATFSVIATGMGTLTYQWQKDLLDLTDGGNISGATTDTLQVSNAQVADEGDYRCVVTNSYGSANSDEVTLTVMTTVAPDLDADCDVDPDDFGLFQACASGPNVPHSGTPTCHTADFDNDNDIDQEDFGVFQRCFSGEGNPPNPNCAD
ncbi:MAG: immunoglobulin domain-containing protein [Planctomycetota bacterium]